MLKVVSALDSVRIRLYFNLNINHVLTFYPNLCKFEL